MPDVNMLLLIESCTVNLFNKMPDVSASDRKLGLINLSNKMPVNMLFLIEILAC